MTKSSHQQMMLKLPDGAIVIRHACCPNGCNLMDQTTQIHGLPSICVRYLVDGRSGLAHLDPLYGRFDNMHDWEPPAGTVVEFSCPTCNVSLRSRDESCRICSAPMFTIVLTSGQVEGCLRQGCHYHSMTIVDHDALMQRLFVQHQLDAYL